MTSARRRAVLGSGVHVVSPQEAVDLVAAWATGSERQGRTVFAANVHMIMEAREDASFRAVLDQADCVVPDGVPIVWALRLLGEREAQRVRMAPDLVLTIMARAAQLGLAVGLYGGTPESLDEMQRRLRRRLPSLLITYAWAPPFRPLTDAEDRAVVDAIRSAGVDVLFVGIGCPKQERWIAAHRTRLACVLLGVGAAFDLLAGRTREAPVWMQRAGLEWLYRLVHEPRRLWRRYVRHNPRFLVLLAAQVVRERRRRRRGAPAGRRDERPPSVR